MIELRFLIDERLPARLSAIESALDIRFLGGIVERILADSENDQVNQKEYKLVDSWSLQIAGLVEEYEPDEVVILIHGRWLTEARCRRRLDQLFPAF